METPRDFLLLVHLVECGRSKKCLAFFAGFTWQTFEFLHELLTIASPRCCGSSARYLFVILVRWTSPASRVRFLVHGARLAWASHCSSLLGVVSPSSSSTMSGRGLFLLFNGQLVFYHLYFVSWLVSPGDDRFSGRFSGIIAHGPVITGRRSWWQSPAADLYVFPPHLLTGCATVFFPMFACSSRRAQCSDGLSWVAWFSRPGTRWRLFVLG